MMHTQHTLWAGRCAAGVAKIVAVSALFLACSSALTERAVAQELQETPPAQQAARVPQILHDPSNSWDAGEGQQVEVSIEGDWLLTRAYIGIVAGAHVPTPALKTFSDTCEAAGHTIQPNGVCEIEIVRVNETRFVAPIPAALVQPPAVQYFIASVDQSGVQREHFASAQQPFTMLVHGETEAMHEAELLDRHGGHRSRFLSTSDVTFYGRSRAPGSTTADLRSDADATDSLSDWFWTTTLEYTYRPLQWIYAFRFGVSVMRGSIPEVNGAVLDPTSATPGMNSGYGELDFELHRNFSLATRINLGATEDGFAAGGGALVRIGPRHATHLQLGFDWMTRIAGRYFLSLAWTTIPRVPMSFTIEATQRPSAEYARVVTDTNGNTYTETVEAELGTRLMLDVGWEITDQLTLGLKGGYATRSRSLSSGFVGGLDAAFEF
jgi:hypothetical protein